ncbi:RES domain-containing protein [Oceanicola sp. D3]|uniref:RES family NAD+ phosphorylase n=1 Tax=Oceanicola sp. D3 TaxID=2587163 RepID=UPI00111E722D|nr:RES domain-containing protein [Oceanicola sp. D3]QDC11143.1 RES domain-containing protein [Oceanicola sp. D3]
MRWSGTVFRALNPYWAYRPLSGEGAAQFGGRFNSVGQAALYTSLTVETALREAQQAGSFMPVTVVALAVEVEQVFDATNADALAGEALTRADLAQADWADEADRLGVARVQRIAERLAKGYNGLLVESFAPGAAGGNLNLVLWHWGEAAPNRVRVIDDQDRLRYPPQAPD